MNLWTLSSLDVLFLGTGLVCKNRLEYQTAYKTCFLIDINLKGNEGNSRCLFLRKS